MRNILTTAAVVAAILTGQMVVAADGNMPAPLPGPYYVPYQPPSFPQQNAIQPVPFGASPNAAFPQAQQQPYWMQAPNQQLPYWMQGSPQPFANNAPAQFGNAQTGGQLQSGFDFNAQTQARGGNTFNQGYGTGSAPGYFPGYRDAPRSAPNINTAQTNEGYAPQQILPSYQGYPAQQGWNGAPWYGQWGAPNSGTWGQNPYSGYGQVPQGYGAPLWQ